jgi:hypothetical protein
VTSDYAELKYVITAVSMVRPENKAFDPRRKQLKKLCFGE